VTVATRLTLDEFLALPETEPPSEFACGRVIPKPMPTFFHGFIAAWLIEAFAAYFRAHPVGYVLTEARHSYRPEERAYLPDVGVVLRANVPASREVLRKGPLETRPDLAVEILSPDDRPGRVADKLAFYLRTRVPLTWIIDPDERTLTAYRPGEPPSVYTAPEFVGAEPVLDGFPLDLGRLFAELDSLGT
jgi:Uma2 family endonuclease